MRRSLLFRLGVMAAANRRTVFAGWALAALLSLASLPGLLSTIGLPAIGITHSEANRAADALVKDFPVVGREQMYLIFHSDSLVVTDPLFASAMVRAGLALKSQEGVVSVLGLPLAGAAHQAAKIGPMNFGSLPYRDPHNAYALVGMNGDDPQLLERFAAQRQVVEQEVRREAGEAITVHFAGRIPSAHEMRLRELADSSRSEMLAVPLALIILVLGLGTVGSAVVPLITASAGILVTVGAFAVLSRFVSFDSNLLFASSVTGFAVGIDYLLLLMSRYREELCAGRKQSTAIGIATAAAGRTIACSGLVALLAISCMLIVQTPLITQFVAGACAAILVQIAVAITLGPALLVACTHLLERGRVPGLAGDRPADEGTWARWARHLMRYPRLYLCLSAALLILLALPAMGLRTGSDLQSGLPADSRARAAFELLERDSFLGAAGWVSIVVPRSEPAARVQAAISALKADPQVVAVGHAVGVTITGIAVIPREGATAAATGDLVRRIRTDIGPQHFTAPVLVGGMAALLNDDHDELRGKTLAMIGLIVLSSFLLLLLIFRSLLVAIKAVLTNALAVAAGIGVVVVVFQWGYGESLLRFTSDGSILYYSLYVAFVFVYALSMDYEIFLVRRMQEAYLSTGDNDLAVATGLQRSARPIVVAGGVMVAVYLGLLFSTSMGIRQLGLALVAAIAIDITLVRLVLVPASMKILGRWNWWLPGHPQQSPRPAVRQQSKPDRRAEARSRR